MYKRQIEIQNIFSSRPLCLLWFSARSAQMSPYGGGDFVAKSSHVDQLVLI